MLLIADPDAVSGQHVDAVLHERRVYRSGEPGGVGLSTGSPLDWGREPAVADRAGHRRGAGA